MFKFYFLDDDIEHNTSFHSNTNTLYKKKKMLHSLGLVYKPMRGVMTNSMDRDQWLNVTSESRDRI
jgi:hypothetical protein